MIFRSFTLEQYESYINTPNLSIRNNFHLMFLGKFFFKNFLFFYLNFKFLNLIIKISFNKFLIFLS